jgi:hypothetical protein
MTPFEVFRLHRLVMMRPYHRPQPPEAPQRTREACTRATRTARASLLLLITDHHRHRPRHPQRRCATRSLGADSGAIDGTQQAEPTLPLATSVRATRPSPPMPSTGGATFSGTGAIGRRPPPSNSTRDDERETEYSDDQVKHRLLLLPWLRLGCAALPRSATFCNLRRENR